MDAVWYCVNYEFVFDYSPSYPNSWCRFAERQVADRNSEQSPASHSGLEQSLLNFGCKYDLVGHEQRVGLEKIVVFVDV
jgi:hypothetical protein